jgi:transcriptional regulator with XRE-family HTH domain
MEAANYTDVLPIGRKIEAVRRLRGMTQAELGNSLGVTKQAVSKMERVEQIDDEKIKGVAKALGVTADAIRNFNEDATFNIIANSYRNHSSSVNYQFHPIEKIVELYQEKIALYERMIKEKDDLLQKILDDKK